MPEPITSAEPRIQGGVRESRPHDSGAKHASGEAVYIDDIVEPLGCLHLFAAPSAYAHARLTRLDVSAVRAAPGVACVLTADDIPGHNDVSPTGTNDDPCLADDLIHFLGQPLFALKLGTR